MSLVVCDVESDGPIPNLYSMVCFGAVIVDRALDKTFLGKTWPVSDNWNPEALAISGITREEHMKHDNPEIVMREFRDWIKENSKGTPIFISDNPAYDWSFINYYFHYYLGSNPFGFSARRIGDLYAGMMRDTHVKWKHLRDTKHDHNPVNDAKGNAEVLIKMYDMGLKFKLN